MSKIAIIVVYFGKLPSFFSIWLMSCEKNSSIDFIIFTDQKIKTIKKNIHIINMSFEESKLLAEKQLKEKIRLEKPYKWCDLRPMYGVIFSEYLINYDYWGHCDIDMVFGDIRAFLDEYHIEKYDKFLTQGHLSLYKNTEEVNCRYKSDGGITGNWREVINSPYSFTFDEIAGIGSIYKKNGYSMFSKRIFADISIIYHRFRLALDDKNYKHQVFLWKDGKVYRAYYEKEKVKYEEFIYIHFKKRKMQVTFDLSNQPRSFFIIPNRFVINDKEKLDVDDIKTMNPYYGMIYEVFENNIYKIKTLLTRIRNKIV